MNWCLDDMHMLVLGAGCQVADNDVYLVMYLLSEALRKPLCFVRSIHLVIGWSAQRDYGRIIVLVFVFIFRTSSKDE